MNGLLGLCFVLSVCFGTGLVAAETRIEVGKTTFEVSISRTATLFHVVDQLSEWSKYCHREYGRAFAPLTDEDRAFLQKHRDLRARHGWSGPLEQTLYSDLPLDEALKAGVDAGRLTRAEAAMEREVIAHFESRIDALSAAQAATLIKFRDDLKTRLPAAAPWIAQFARFAGTSPELLPIFLIPDPDPKNHGGGYNGGRVVVEIPSAMDAMGTTLHEIFHAFLDPRKRDLERAAAGVTGLSSETLNEGIAYAFAPGIVHGGPAESDPLADTVARDYASGTRLSDDSYVRSNRYGLALRPLLREALADSNQTLDTFLPRALDVWRAIAELDGKPEEELKTVTILAVLRTDSPALPDFVRKGNNAAANEYFVSIREWVKGTYRQMRTFYGRAGHEALLLSPGHSDLHARFNGHNVSQGDGTFQAFGLEIVTDDRAKIVAGAEYVIRPTNTDATYRWEVSDRCTPIKLKE